MGGADAIINDGGTEGTGGYNLTINNSIFFTTADPTISLANTTANTITINGAINNNSRTITINNIGNNTNITISGVISGIGGLIKNGTGTLLLSGANTYSGMSTLNTGIIKLNNSQSFGLTGTVVINGGELDTYPSSVTLTDHPMIWNSNFSLTGTRNVGLGNGPVTMTTDITISVVDAKTLTVGGSISGDYKLTKTGLGILALNGANNYTKTTTVNAGTIRLGNASALGTTAATTTISTGELKLGADEVLPNSTPLTVNGTLNLNSHSETVGSITGAGFIDNLTGAGTPTFIFGGNNQTTDFAGVLKNTTGILNVTKTGTGKIYLDGNNTYYGQTYIDDGFLELRNGKITSN